MRKDVRVTVSTTAPATQPAGDDSAASAVFPDDVAATADAADTAGPADSAPGAVSGTGQDVAGPSQDVAGGLAGGQARSLQAARPQLLRTLNEQLLLQHIRQLGRCSRAELA